MHRVRYPVGCSFAAILSGSDVVVIPGIAILYPNVAKVRGLQSQDAKGAVVVNLLQALGNAGSGVLRLSPKNIRSGGKKDSL
jgi:hypothetical protein